MKLFSSLLVRMCLNAQGLVDRKDLEEERKVSLGSSKFFGDLSPDEVWVCSQDSRETQARADYP